MAVNGTLHTLPTRSLETSLENVQTRYYNNKKDLTKSNWKFVICAASFYVNAIAWGFISCTGIFENAFKEVYDLSSFISSLPGSFQICSMSVFSILSSVLATKYSVRWTTLSGAIISSVGSLLAAVIGRFWSYCLFGGLMVGSGEAIMLVPAILAIPPYFNQNRVSLATASAVSGASLGMSCIPLLIQYFLDTYGLNGASLLSSALWLSVCFSASLFGRGVTGVEESEDDEIKLSSSYKRKGSLPPVMTRRSTSPAIIFNHHDSRMPNSSRTPHSLPNKSYSQQHLKPEQFNSSFEVTIADGAHKLPILQQITKNYPTSQSNPRNSRNRTKQQISPMSNNSSKEEFSCLYNGTFGLRISMELMK
ncbi:unnamed protein product [Didymodactylos carnosus]|uniref:Uncharacterized protein n=1 Tax=Didymodactylos carnosus TaxID=1234261 RepID=A0A8S2JIJ0_9BILA|nr:unnamed protein product [Didymodactylos carnosus]CAF3809399.1 unnamed protein product [Didymodactylos carnosus]